MCAFNYALVLSLARVAVPHVLSEHSLRIGAQLLARVEQELEEGVGWAQLGADDTTHDTTNDTTRAVMSVWLHNDVWVVGRQVPA
jgi:hypothetical protein